MILALRRAAIDILSDLIEFFSSFFDILLRHAVESLWKNVVVL